MSSQFYTEDVPETLLRCLGDVEWSSFADLGCGEGVILNALDQMGLFSGKSVYAVDQSEERLSRVKQINNNFTCLAADASQTTIESNSIDLVISTQVIEHVPDDEAMVKEIQRILIPGGTAFVDTIFKKWYGWYFYRCNGKWTMDPTHVREYTEDKQLLDLFTKNGLGVQATKKNLRQVPLMDSVLRRLGASRDAYRNSALNLLRNITLPIPGYYIWEVICKKP
jgi:2-polyprenyl-3-methyl-5-hydroxy-6-metoxy-1,4-benzoquinol methylase